MLKEGSKVWVLLSLKRDEWIPGILKRTDGLRRVVVVGNNQEKSVPYGWVSRWNNERIRSLSSSARFIKSESPVVEAVEVLQLENWLKQVEVKLGVSIPMRCYEDKDQRSTLVAALLPRTAATADKSAPFSWREMALIGDALWCSYLRIVFVKRGYRNGKVATVIAKKRLESRKSLIMVGQKLDLVSLLPISSGKPHQGELVEAFLGWAYTFGGEQAYLRLAQKYLEVLEAPEEEIS